MSTMAMKLIHDMMDADRDGIAPLIDRLLACHKDFPFHFLQKSSGLLRDDRVLDNVAICLIALCGSFIQNEPLILSKPDIVEESNLVPNLMIACKRQMCSSTLSDAQLFVMTTLESLL